MNTILAILTAIVNSLWQAIAVAALVWLALRLAQRTNAATRYAIWWAALAVVLVLPVAPRLIPMLRPHAASVAVKASKTPAVAAPAVITEPVIVTIAPGRTAKWPIAILVLWAAILLWRLCQIVRSYFYLRGVKRRAAVSPIPLPDIPRHADLLISPDVVSPMAVGFLRPAIVLPESLLEELSEPEREHVLLHEAAHLAKYDDWSNLAMRILAGALALHPAATWILWQIEREREMACDDWVVARTGAARPYAASLAHLFELRRARRGEVLASGIFGNSSGLGDRVEMLLRRGRTFSPRASAIGVVATTVVLSILMLAGSFAPRWIAFAQEQPRLSFEVASVKPSRPDGQLLMRLEPGGRYIMNNLTLKLLIANAYAVPEPRISGGPGWRDSDRFDIEARVGIAIPPWPDSMQQLSQMLQSMLADRFKLTVHRETREEPVYELVAAKGGAKLLAAADDAPAGFEMAAGRIKSMAVPLRYLAINLEYVLGRPVIDRTGLEGKYDYTVTYTPDNAPPADTNGASIFTALQNELGLRLQPAKAPVELLVIDHAEKPDAN
jgi:uncharacterized protein (TIGR03435 family)